MTIMLPQSCDPGYGELGIQEGVATLRQQAELFGVNSQPPIDLPSNTQQPVGGVVAVDAAGTAGQFAGLPGLHRHRAGNGPGHGAAERDGGRGHRQRRQPS